MTPPFASSRSHRSTTRIGGIILLLFAGAILLFIFPWGSGANSELVRDNVTIPARWVVRDGKLIEAKRVGTNFVIATSPVKGGAETVLFSMDMSYRSINRLNITDTEFRFQTSADWSPAQITPAVAGSPMAGGYIEGESLNGYSENMDSRLYAFKYNDFLAPDNPSKIPTGARRHPKNRDFTLTTTSKIRTILHRVPLDRSPPKTHLFEWMGIWGDPVYTEEFVFYRRAPREDFTEVTLPGGETFSEYRAEASLYARPLSGGPERLIYSGLPSNWGLGVFPDSIGVSIPVVRPYPEPPYDLLRFSAKGEKPVRIPNFQGTKPPILYQERLWWLEFQSVLDAPQSVVQKLVSCRLDGSDRQTTILEKDADGKIVISRELIVGGDSLFLGYIREEGNVYKPGESSVKTTGKHLARLYTDQENRMSKSIQIPPKSSEWQAECCDNGYYYFFTEEIRRDTLDFLKDEATDKKVIVLRRIRLPE